MGEITALSLVIGASGEHSKSRRGSGCKPKSPDSSPIPCLVPRSTARRDRSRRPREQRWSYEEEVTLSEEPLTVLETVYEENSNLDPAVRKAQGLAKKLGIKQRQVEVWFQNRRARSKQKQTVADCENLKRRSEGLIRENQKLKRESKGLVSISQHGNSHHGSNLVAMCSSCNKIFRDHHNHNKL